MRRTSIGPNAHLLPSGGVDVYVTKLAGSSTEALVGSAKNASGISYSAGSTLRLKLTLSTSGGATTLALKVWTGASEPAAAQLSVSDSSAGRQSVGSIGIRAYLSASSTSAPVGVYVSSLSASP